MIKISGAQFAYFAGAGNLKKDIELMVGFSIGWHWWFCWRFISPVLLIVSVFRSAYRGQSIQLIGTQAFENNIYAD